MTLIVSLLLSAPATGMLLVSTVRSRPGRERLINYVGHAETWDELTIDGDIAAKNCLLRFRRNGRTLAVATIFRDVESLQAELAMERDEAA